MSTREAKETKEKLQKHKQDFKNIHVEAEIAQKQFKEKIYQEILRLDEEDKERTARINNRKKMLAYKATIDSPYVQDKDDLDVPVDGSLKSGSMVFMKNCASCHSLQPIDPKPSKAPSLGLIYNRKVGSNPSFDIYSNHLLKANFFWTGKNLYNFMANTSSLVPKTNCKLASHPLKSEEDRADLLALFRDFTAEMTFNMRLKQIEAHGYIRYQTQLNTMKDERLRGKMREESEKSRQRKI